LIEARSFASAVIDRATQGLCVCHQLEEYPFVRFTVWNERMVEITGYTIEEINRLGWYQTMYPDSEVQMKARERMERMRKGDDLNGEEWQIIRRDGTKRLLSMSTTLLETDDGITHVLALMHDISQQRRDQEKLRQSEEMLRALTENIQEVLWLRTPTKMLHISRIYEKLWGKSRESLYENPSSFLDAIHPDDKARIEAAFQEEQLQGGRFKEEFRVVQPDGSSRWILARTFPVTTHSKEEWRVGIAEDITERKQMEEALYASEARLKTVLDTLPVGVVVADADGRIVWDNAATRELWGVPPETESWETYANWVGWWPDTGERIKAEEWAMTRALLHGEETRNELVQNQRFVSHERRYYLNNVAPLRNAEGRIVGGVAAMLDVTETKQAQDEIQNLAKFPSENPYPVIRVAKDGTILYANDASRPCLKTWKCKTGQCLPDDWRQQICDAVDSGSAREIELECEDQIFSLAIMPVVDADYINLYGTDVTNRKKTEQELNHSAQKSQALNRISDLLHSLFDYNEVAQRLVDEGAMALGSDTAALSLRQDEGWTVKYVYGIPESVIGLWTSDEQEKHAVQAIQCGQPVVVEDTFNDDRFNREHFKRYKIRAVMVSPLIVRHQAIGVIFFNYHREPHKFSESEVYFARQLAATASIALQNVRLIDDLKQVQDTLEKSHDELEVRVQERTAELEELNEQLRQEVEKRKKFELALKAEGNKVLRAYEQRDYLSRRLVDLLEKERTDIGNALHDEIGQIMAGVSMQLEALKEIRTKDGSSLADRVEPIQKHLREAVRQAKGLSNNLRSEALERLGLIPSIRELVDETQKQYSMKIHLFTKNVPEDLEDTDKSLTLFRLVQEALTNIHKHAEAKVIFINLIGRDGKLCLTIEDDGVGFDYPLLSKQEGGRHASLGLTIMRERVSMIGGIFRIETAPGKGTHILAEIPCQSY